VKRSGKYGVIWQKRYVVVLATPRPVFQYYRTDAHDTDPQGIIDLTIGTEVNETTHVPLVQAFQYGWCLNAPRAKRAYYFASRSPQERSNWLEAIQESIKTSEELAARLRQVQAKGESVEQSSSSSPSLSSSSPSSSSSHSPSSPSSSTPSTPTPGKLKANEFLRKDIEAQQTNKDPSVVIMNKTPFVTPLKQPQPQQPQQQTPDQQKLHTPDQNTPNPQKITTNIQPANRISLQQQQQQPQTTPQNKNNNNNQQQQRSSSPQTQKVIVSPNPTPNKSKKEIEWEEKQAKIEEEKRKAIEDQSKKTFRRRKTKTWNEPKTNTTSIKGTFIDITRWNSWKKSHSRVSNNTK